MRGEESGQPTFAAPWVTVVVNAQFVAASFVSRPFGIRDSEPVAVFESAVAAGSTVPSTRSAPTAAASSRSTTPARALPI